MRRKILHDVPENRLSTHLDHGLRAIFGFFPQSGTKTARQQHHFHAKLLKIAAS
jgi:hypothetical protein